MNKLFVWAWCGLVLVGCSGPERTREGCEPFCVDGTWRLRDFVVHNCIVGFPVYGSQFDSLLMLDPDTWEVKGDTIILTPAGEATGVKFIHRKTRDTLLLASSTDSSRFILKHVGDTIQLELLGRVRAELQLTRCK